MTRPSLECPEPACEVCGHVLHEHWRRRACTPPSMAALEQTIETKIARGEANYWDTFDAEGKVKR